MPMPPPLATQKHFASLPNRIETHWILPTVAYATIRTQLRSLCKSLKYSDKPWVQDILFNNDSHDLTPDIGIKLRRYFNSPTKSAFRLTPGKWFLETKLCTRGSIHHELKERIPIDLHQAIKRYCHVDILCHLTHHGELCPLNAPLRPYIAIEYHREHFVMKKGGDQCRITLDRDIRFWHQLAEGTWIPLGYEHGIRLEIKYLPEFSSTAILKKFLHILIANQALPIIGKRYTALNRISAWQRTIVPLPLNELPGEEYGISFNVSDTTLHELSSQLYHLFAHNRHFTIKAGRQWISEGGLIRIYFKGSLRLNLYGDTFRWIINLNRRQAARASLVRRQRQEKSEHRLITPSQIKEFFSQHSYHGALLQNRRQFWIEDKDQRIYQVSVYRSSNFISHHTLVQLDLQYVGRANPDHSRHPRATIEQQLRAIARLVKIKSITLSPTHLSLFALAAAGDKTMVNPVAYVLSRLGSHLPRESGLTL